MADEHTWHLKRPPGRVVRRIAWDGSRADVETLLRREWLVANGLGGFASGTVAGACTRKYHGLLVAALPVPQGRVVMLTNLLEELRFADNTTAELGGELPMEGEPALPGVRHLTEFRLENGLPVWRFDIGGRLVEKRILLPHMQNTVLVNYRLVQGEGPVRLRLYPMMHFRSIEAEVSTDEEMAYTVTALANRYEVRKENFPFLRLFLYGEQGAFNLSGGECRKVVYNVEESRGYAFHGSLWNPGFFRVMLTEKEEATLMASTDPWSVALALDPSEAFRAENKRSKRLLAAANREVQTGIGAELVLAADQFIITPVARIVDATWARAGGDEIRTIIAGYHWFTDWGRDTMISLEGLTLTTGRFAEAGYILRTFVHYVRDGLIPNMFPEGEAEGLYHTADATLWFFHAVDRYLHFTGDLTTLDLLLPTLIDIIDHHMRGTSFGIGMDPADGLLRQGQEGYQLTWMDAKVGDWVVTPRRGKAVEINALWYNALRLLEGWLGSEGSKEDARPFTELAEQIYQSFNRRFWIEERGYLYDVIDGEQSHDPSLRPNQILAISLAHPVLDPSRWQSVLDVVRDRLLTPVGLRSLASGHPDYKTRYSGDLRSRDAAYHQGTVWAWLIGPFVDAWIKTYPEDRAGARRFLEGIASHLDEACIGSISEIFDADPPNSPEGCIAQAWSVAEFLRCWMNTAPN